MELFAADIEVTVSGIRSGAGQLRLAIFDQAQEFPRGNEIRSLDVDANVGNVVAIFRGMHPGVYAVAIHHDANSNKEMDTNFIGLPKEGFGFSNNARVIFGPPSFGAASFILGSSNKRIRMRIIY